MLEKNSEVAEPIRAMLVAACLELMAAYGVQFTVVDEQWIEVEEVALSGIMGFVGEKLRGTCVFAASEEVLRAAAPESAGLRDWVGELSNQLVGRLKAKLLACGVTIKLGTPVVLTGIRLSPLPRSNGKPVVVSDTAGRRAFVWLELEIDSELKLEAERPLLTGEGELLVF